MPSRKSSYHEIITELFRRNYRPGVGHILFDQGEISRIAEELGIPAPKNLRDITYAFAKGRLQLPEEITKAAPVDRRWALERDQWGSYSLKLVETPDEEITADPDLPEISLPDLTPPPVQYFSVGTSLLLAQARHNRLVDLVTGCVCHPTEEPKRRRTRYVQVEVDDAYFAFDAQGGRFYIPVELTAKGERRSITDMDRLLRIGTLFHRSLQCRPVLIEEAGRNRLRLYAFEVRDATLKLRSELHVHLGSDFSG